MSLCEAIVLDRLHERGSSYPQTTLNHLLTLVGKMWHANIGLLDRNVVVEYNELSINQYAYTRTLNILLKTLRVALGQCSLVTKPSAQGLQPSATQSQFPRPPPL